MKTTWFTVATGSEQYVRMACLLSKNWTKHNNSELVIVTDSDLPEKMGIPNLIYKKWKNYKHWGWYFKFEAYNQIINYNKADIYCFLDCDVMPVKKTDLSYIDKLSKYGCHIAMEEDMIGDGVAEWWGFKNPHLTNYMIREIRKNHPEARQAWHGNGGFHFWHRDLLKKNRYYRRAHQIFEDLQKVKDATGSGFPCDEPVQQVMVQEIVKPKDIYHHTLESGVSKHIQETVFWEKIPEKPTTIDKTSYFTGKRKWSCEPSNIHLINGKKELVRLSELEDQKFKGNKRYIISKEDSSLVFEFYSQNITGDALISKKNSILIISDTSLIVDEKEMCNFFDAVEKVQIDQENINYDVNKKSISALLVIGENDKWIHKAITKNHSKVKNGGVVLSVNISNFEANNDDIFYSKANYITLPNKYKTYMVDLLRKKYFK